MVTTCEIAVCRYCGQTQGLNGMMLPGQNLYCSKFMEHNRSATPHTQPHHDWRWIPVVVPLPIR